MALYTTKEFSKMFSGSPVLMHNKKPPNCSRVLSAGFTPSPYFRYGLGLPRQPYSMVKTL